MQHPNIEVFILTYNRKNYLKYSINSILNQSYKPYRVTIIDNGSIDGTSDMCQEYRNNGVIYLKNTENEQFSVWEQIKNLVDSDYFMVFHDDDLLHSDYLKYVYEIINSNNNVVMVGCATGLSNISKINSYIFRTEKLQYKEFNTRSLASLLFKGFPLPFCSIIYKSEHFKNISFDFNSYGKFFDRPLILNFSKNGNVVIIKNKLVRTFVHVDQDSMTINKGGNEEKLINVIKAYKNILGTSFFNRYSFTFLVFNYKWLLYFYKWSGKQSSKHHFFSNAIKDCATTKFALAIGFVYFYFLDFRSKARLALKFVSSSTNN
jgi:glycosyltransferase involved in cell wall biosynthesis